MPKFRYTEWQNVASEVQTLRLTVLDQLNSFKEAQQAFQSAGKLSGTGWDSTKSYFDAYSEVSTTVGNALNTLDDAITSYLSAFTSEVGPAENDLDTAKMEGLKAELRRLQAENDVIMEALAKAFEDVPFVNQFFNKQSMLGTAKKIEILEKYSAFEASHGSDFSDVQTVITSIAEGLAFLGSAGNFSGGKDGYKTIDFKNQKWYKALKDFNKEQPKDRIDVVIKELSNGVEYQIYRNGKLDVQRTKELHELFRVHNVELFKEYGPEIFKILTDVDDIEILFGKDSTTMQRSSSGVFLLLAILPIDRVKDILKSADVVKTVDRGKDVGKVGINFGSSEKLEIHFSKHGSEMKQALNKKNYTVADYLSDANHIINEGQFVPEMNGYVKLISGEGSAKYAFVGLDRTTGNITTLHLKSVKELAKKAPSLGLKP